MLTQGDEVQLRSSGTVLSVGRFLGGGGQGSVFEVATGTGGGALALKWYRSDAATMGQAERLERILDAGAPSDAFLWPIELATRASDRAFGYVMALRRPQMQSLAAVLTGVVPMSLRPTCVAAARLADAFLRLHALGLCYADISLNNVFVDPATGEIEICDNDNVTVDGLASDVLGTPYFMAPEIVRGEIAPNSASDRYSLAVLLFHMLMRHHPLFGARESAAPSLDRDSLARLLGSEPVFVFDPEDESNRPVPRLHDNLLVLWPALPSFAQELFVQAFTSGLTDPAHGRVTESRWRAAMSRLRGSVRRCPTCGAEQFWDPEHPDRACAAPDCRAVMPRPLRLATRYGTVLEPGVQITSADLGGTVEATEQPFAVVVLHPTSGDLALGNRTDEPWALTRPDGSRTTVPPRSAAVAKPGAEIRSADHVLRIVT